MKSGSPRSSFGRAAVLSERSDPAFKQDARRARRDLMRWLLLMPLILLLLFGCGSMAMVGARPAYADTRSMLSADYAPWPFAIFGPVDPDIIMEAVLDQQRYPETFVEPVLPTVIPGGFWTTPTPTPSPTPLLTVSPGPSPSLTLAVTATASASPSPSLTASASPTPSDTPSPSPTFTATATATPSGPPLPTPPVAPPSNTYWFYDDAAPLAYMMYTTSPSGSYRSSDGVSFHSPAFGLGQSIAAGVTTANFYAYNPSGLPAVFTIQLRAGSTLLGSGAFALPANTFNANFFSASFSTSTHAFAAGERLELSFSLPAPALIFWDGAYDYSGVSVPAVTLLPTATPTPSRTPTSTSAITATNSPVPSNTPVPTSTPVPTATDTPLPPGTATNTPPATATDTSVPTATDTPAATATDTPAPTATPVPTATDTPTPSNTPTPTATDTPTPSDTPTPTATDTPTPSDTPTPTATDTPTPSDTPTSTATDTPTPSDTPTPTATDTPTPTATPACQFNDGLVTTDIGPNSDDAYAVTLQPDGKIILVGHSNNGANYDLAVVRYNPDGSLDTSFDSDGIVTMAIGSSWDLGYSAVVQPDGKIVVAGHAIIGPTWDFFAVRFNTDGSLDTSFDGDGIVITAVGSGDDLGYSLGLQSDGKIVLAGVSNNGSNDDFAVVRYNTDGSLDASFGSGGIVTTAIGAGNDFGRAMVLQSDGKIVVAGISNNGSNDDFAAVRYNADGSLDTSFDGDGKVTTDVGGGADTSTAVALQSDDKIVLSGASSNGTNNDIAVVRYNPDGSLDTSFDGDGQVTTAFGTGNENGGAVAVQSDGKIIVAGHSHNGSNYDLAVVRYEANGSLDTTFDDDGKVTTAVGPGNDYSWATAIQTDDKIVLASWSHNGVSYEFALARYNPDGSLDTSCSIPPTATPAPTNTPNPTATDTPLPTGTPTPS
ncbi:MAG TPA: hypothetical protein VGA07_13560, partial [Anaerolineales bacterium]